MNGRLRWTAARTDCGVGATSEGLSFRCKAASSASVATGIRFSPSAGGFILAFSKADRKARIPGSGLRLEGSPVSYTDPVRLIEMSLQRYGVLLTGCLEPAQHQQDTSGMKISTRSFLAFGGALSLTMGLVRAQDTTPKVVWKH